MKAPPYTANRTLLTSQRGKLISILGQLGISATFLAVATVVMPDSYNWVEHTTSESAAQGVADAWIGRTGLVVLGLTVLQLATWAGSRWGLAGRALHRTYGVGLVGTAVFASKPWDDTRYVQLEDTLHSWASGIVGFSFIAGVLIVLLRRPLADRSGRIFDWVAIAVAAGISWLVLEATGWAGLLQRAMFLVAYGWYGREAMLTAGIRAVAARPVEHVTR